MNACAPECKSRSKLNTRKTLEEPGTMATTTTLDREKALAWIARQLRWERTLSQLRADDPRTDEQRKAA
jgi:hypothetical protein